MPSLDKHEQCARHPRKAWSDQPLKTPELECKLAESNQAIAASLRPAGVVHDVCRSGTEPGVCHDVCRSNPEKLTGQAETSGRRKRGTHPFHLDPNNFCLWNKIVTRITLAGTPKFKSGSCALVFTRSSRRCGRRTSGTNETRNNWPLSDALPLVECAATISSLLARKQQSATCHLSSASTSPGMSSQAARSRHLRASLLIIFFSGCEQHSSCDYHD